MFKIKHMRLHILSDLHVEFWQGKDVLKIPKTGADFVILAGDIHTKNRGIGWIRSHFSADTRVLYIPGNHEYYGGAYPQTLNQIKSLARDTGYIFVLDNDFLEFDDVVFLGTTLWTDLNLFGDFITAGRILIGMLSDFRKIRYGQEYRRFSPAHFTHLFSIARTFLKEKLQQFTDRKVVVITHHAPSIKSIDEKFQDDISSAAFASNLEVFICQHPNIKLWVHGHTHNFRDYKICNTRVVANQFGYFDDELVRDFKPDFVVEI